MVFQRLLLLLGLFIDKLSPLSGIDSVKRDSDLTHLTEERVHFREKYRTYTAFI